MVMAICLLIAIPAIMVMSISDTRIEKFCDGARNFTMEEGGDYRVSASLS
jgi:hypothetical protein